MVIFKGEARERVAALVDKYNKLLPEQRKKYTEEETKKDFILPLFEALGWDVYNKREVSAEEGISTGFVDYGFYSDDMVQFYLEAKKLGADLHKEDYANQAVRYAWNKGATWAVLTDFGGIKVFVAQDITKKLVDKLFFEITANDLIARFDQLWLLSKEAFIQGELDAQAEKWGKKLQRVSVTESLYKDLQRCRQILTEAIVMWNKDKKLSQDLIDEGVQKLLDRIIFIRVAEDRGAEPPTLIPMLREWGPQKVKITLYKMMVDKFRELDKIYNSNLFGYHPFEDWDEYSEATAEVIEILHGKQGYYEYDFKTMPADVIGAVYENYLGYKLAQSKKGVNVEKDVKKRKSQGIFYTPVHIVDYVVKTTLGIVLNNCKSLTDLKKIRVLDPACGSGSFLIRAFETILDKYREFGVEDSALTRYEILTQNIYGVDLDSQAVEIARLNLLLAALNDKKMKLPLLNNNIKNGNSVIGGEEKELEKYFGKELDQRRPFMWGKEFSDILDRGGFDVIIGNPPWISNDNIEIKDKEFFSATYKVAEGRFDLSNIFVERSMTLLRENGWLSFVMPEHIWIGEYFVPFRRYLANNARILTILSLKEGQFADVANPSSIFRIQKHVPEQNIQEVELGVFTRDGIKSFHAQVNPEDRVVFDGFVQGLVQRIGSMGFPALGDVALVTDGIQTANLLGTLFTQKPDDGDKYVKALRSGKAIRHRYAPIHWDEWWVMRPEYTRELKRPGFSYDSPKRMQCFAAKEKIILRQTEPTILATIDVDGYIFPNSIFQIALENPNVSLLRHIIGVLNSKLMRFYYAKLAQVEGTTKPQMYLNVLKSLPLALARSRGDSGLIQMVEKILKLNSKLDTLVESSEEWQTIMHQIQLADQDIDKLVFSLYGLSADDIAVVTKSFA